MSKKSRWFLGLASGAMLVAFAHVILPTTIGTGVADFSIGLSTALMLGVLLSWRSHRIE